MYLNRLKSFDSKNTTEPASSTKLNTYEPSLRTRRTQYSNSNDVGSHLTFVKRLINIKMKKQLFLLAIISTVMVFSCKKDYTCVCSNFPTDLGISSKAYDTGKVTKKDAKKSCSDIQKGWYLQPTVTCAIQ